MFGNPRMLLWMTLAAAVIVGAIAALATGKWWVILIPLALHALGTTLVLTGVFRVLGERDKPDPVTQARLDEEGERPATS
jgi:membrane protein implicated in regulation of membrane protease activity